jgi:hypothetical protein
VTTPVSAEWLEVMRRAAGSFDPPAPDEILRLVDEVERLREELKQAEIKGLLNLGRAQRAEEERDRLAALLRTIYAHRLREDGALPDREDG